MSVLSSKNLNKNPGPPTSTDGSNRSAMALAGLFSRLIVVLFVATFIIVFADSVQGMGWRAAGFPQLIMTVLAIAIIVDSVQIITHWLKDSSKTRRLVLPSLPWSPRSWLRVGAVFAGLVVLVELAQLIGFAEASIIFVAWVAFVLRIRPWYWILTYAGLAGILAWLLFIEALGVLVPRGPIF